MCDASIILPHYAPYLLLFSFSIRVVYMCDASIILPHYAPYLSLFSFGIHIFLVMRLINIIFRALPLYLFRLFSVVYINAC